MLSIDDLREAVRETEAEPADALELAALSESLGLTDAGARRLGYESVFEFAEEAFREECKENLYGPKAIRRPSRRERVFRELKCAGSKLSAGLAYSLPWMFLTAAETLYPKALDVPPALGSALSLSIIASLVTTGGFAQAITRDATFFFALHEPQLARRSAVKLMGYGAVVAVAFATVGAFFCFYFNLFPTRYVVLASTHYFLFCSLWMLCAMISAQGLSAMLPLVLLGSAGVIVAVRLFWHPGSTALLLLWPLLATTVALLFCAIKACLSERRHPAGVNSFSPRESIHSYTLLPVVMYGATYFSFLFADRICAGTAVPWSSGLSFGVEPVYKEAMDLNLLAFLLSAILVEYLSDNFIRNWLSRAGALQHRATASLSRLLRIRYCAAVCGIALTFTVLMAGVTTYLPRYMGLHASLALSETLWFGGTGYLLLSVALFGSVILMSVDAATQVVKAVSWGLLANLFVGYTLSHAVAAQFAAVGLMVGACVYTWQIQRAVWKVFAQPDYFYSVV